ncbi:hypothetical protein QJS10_CPA08g01438 [Acorus calamus]|uniref:Uncharacterized protein n=1 Tax=Acorus calamus TaxID=4465 RepID=A0AAV9EB97_ACOCL|nr:hypothetical protein QJS10_CPA08g01438 [Acorus calamus]
MGELEDEMSSRERARKTKRLDSMEINHGREQEDAEESNYSPHLLRTEERCSRLKEHHRQ